MEHRYVEQQMQLLFHSKTKESKYSENEIKVKPSEDVSGKIQQVRLIRQKGILKG
jgi:hypothetical protein